MFTKAGSCAIAADFTRQQEKTRPFKAML